MNKEIMKPKVKKAGQRLCPACGKRIVGSRDFRDDWSWIESYTSSLCLACQDVVFGEA